MTPQDIIDAGSFLLGRRTLSRSYLNKLCGLLGQHTDEDLALALAIFIDVRGTEFLRKNRSDYSSLFQLAARYGAQLRAIHREDAAYHEDLRLRKFYWLLGQEPSSALVKRIGRHEAGRNWQRIRAEGLATTKGGSLVDVNVSSVGPRNKNSVGATDPLKLWVKVQKRGGKWKCVRVSDLAPTNPLLALAEQAE